VEIVTGGQLLNLSRRDADVALRPSLSPPENLHGRRVAQIAFAIYGAEGWDEEQALREGAWIGYEDSLSHLQSARWVGRNVSPDRIALRASSLTAMLLAVREAIGLALLPCYMADGVAGLRRVGAVLPDVRTDLWLLVHDDIRRTARIRAFTDFAAPELAALRSLFEGGGGD
jgi:DNA-binding transcriptional LysR family regulator